MLLLSGASLPILAQNANSSVPGDSCTLNISRVFAWQEYNNGTSVLSIMVCINGQPLCELNCPGRITVQVAPDRKIKLSLKYVPKGVWSQKKIDKRLHPGEPMDFEVAHGKTYYLHVALVEKTFGTINIKASLASTPESEQNWKEESRFKKNHEIIKCRLK